MKRLLGKQVLKEKIKELSLVHVNYEILIWFLNQGGNLGDWYPENQVKKVEENLANHVQIYFTQPILLSRAVIKISHMEILGFVG